MMHIVQLAPVIGPGSGVGGVAWNLEQQFGALGHTVERFTLADARRRPARPWPKALFWRAFARFRQMIWFSTVGTVRARRFLAARPGAVSICHNNLMVGDVFVNHGVVADSMRARGGGWWRMLRNPTHVFTFARDMVRYHSRVHRTVVALAPAQLGSLRRVYGRVRPPVVVIPNGVDLDRFHPASADERAFAREQFRLGDDDRVALFVGHEFERKGLDVAIRALRQAPTVLLLVAGGNEQSIAAARGRAVEAGVAERVLFMGPRTSDLPVFFAAADMFVLPSAYEANALVILEALAAGIPVVASRVGYAPELVVDGVNGFLTDRDPAEVARRFEQVAAASPAEAAAFARAARATAERHGWRATAERYVELLEGLRAGGVAAGETDR